MEQYIGFNIKLNDSAHFFYNEIAELVNRPIEDILSETLCNYADIVLRSFENSEGGR